MLLCFRMVFIAAGTAQGGECVVLSVDLHSGCSVRLDVAKCQFFWLFLLDGYARLAVCFHWFVKADAAFLPVSRICPHKSGFSCGKNQPALRKETCVCAQRGEDLCGKERRFVRKTLSAGAETRLFFSIWWRKAYKKLRHVCHRFGRFRDGAAFLCAWSGGAAVRMLLPSLCSLSECHRPSV